MLIGVIRFTVRFLRAETAGRERLVCIDGARRDLGRYILIPAGIVSDIIATALSRELSDLVFLGLLVAIRSAVSCFPEREVSTIRADG